MPTLYVDDRPIPFDDGDNVLKAALRAGIELPHFCYHDALGSLGACRLCAVELAPDEAGQSPRVIIACMEAARDGMRVSLAAPAARRMREGIIELTMTNHPHDCPVCDEGGECHLQDMTVACGPPYRRYRGRKRTFENQDLGPLVHHEMNRCITCYRCTRFYQEYALGDDLGAMRLRNEVYFGRFEDGALQSPFAGNLVEICPTGVFTDKLFRHHVARVWDLETAPSLCPHCSVGCNTLPGARHGSLRRVRHRSHPMINRWFICDRGRYGHEYNEHPRRPLKARVDGATVDLAQALDAAAQSLIQAGSGVAGLGSAREDLDSNAGLLGLMTALDGRFAAFAEPATETTVLAAVDRSATDVPSLRDMEQADVVLVVGDLTAHAPMMDLAVRQAIRCGAPLILLHSVAAPLARFATVDVAVAPSVLPVWLQRLERQLEQTPVGDVDAGAAADVYERVGALLRHAQRPLLLGVAEELTAAGVHALADIREALAGQGMNRPRLAFALPGANAWGAALLSRPGASLELLQAVETGRVRVLIIAGQDPLGGSPLAARWRAAVRRVATLIVLDCLDTATAQAADILLPVASWPERAGVSINYEGRAQGFARVVARQDMLPPPRILAQLGGGRSLPSSVEPLQSLDPAYIPPEPGSAGRLLACRGQGGGGAVIGAMQTVRWQAALASWYGEDAFTEFAAALASLSPVTVARLSPASAAAAAIEAGVALRLRGPQGAVTLPVIIDAAVADGVLALPRVAMMQLGAEQGAVLDVEAVT